MSLVKLFESFGKCSLKRNQIMEGLLTAALLITALHRSLVELCCSLEPAVGPWTLVQSTLACRRTGTLNETTSHPNHSQIF